MSPLRRSAHLTRSLYALIVCGAPLAPQQVASFAPDDARFAYTGYACGQITPERASFDRELAELWICGQEEMSPGVQLTFRAEASHVRFELAYHSAGFLCGAGEAVPLSWEFGLAVDGVRRPTGLRNPLYPFEFGSTQWVWIDAPPGPHQITLIWPSGADVDLVRVHLMETRDGSQPEVLPQEVVPQLRFTIFGDSVTHGLGASHVLNTFPLRLGVRKGWEVVNLGFAGRATAPSDAYLAAGITVCPQGSTQAPDLLMLAIGSNDFHLVGGIHTKLARFEQRYRDWLLTFRALRPETPVLCLTPVPRGDECSIRNRTLEQYREAIRAIVHELADPRVYLFEGRDLIDLPPRVGDPLYDVYLLHPNDVGNLQVADRLVRFNLVRNGGFELRPLAECAEAPEAEPYLWTNLGPGPSGVSETGDGNRILALGSSGAREQEIPGLSGGDRFTLQLDARSSLEGHVGRITLEFLDREGQPVGAPVLTQHAQNSWRTLTRGGTVPEGALRGRLRIEKGPGPGTFQVDDVELSVAEF